MQIRWALPAANDLESISTYLEKKSSLAVANKVCRALYDSVQILQNYPRLGKSGKRAGTRELIRGRYVIVYRIGTDAIEVLRIWHSAQNRI